MFNNQLRKSIDEVVDNFRSITDCYKDTRLSTEMIEKTQKRIIESQQDTIQLLILALCNKCPNGLLIVSDGGNKPVVINNGREITSNTLSGFNVAWRYGESPRIVFEERSAPNKILDDKK